MIFIFRSLGGINIKTTANYLEEVNKYSAKNYNPLPLVLEKGHGIFVYDIEGKKYIDMLSSYSALNYGHRHPKIIDALIEQASRITLTSRAFHNTEMGPFLKKLCEISNFDQGLLMNSGAEAVETGLKAARKWGHINKGIEENAAEIIVCSNNFHGRTISIVSFSTEEQYKKGFGPYTPGFKVIPFGDTKALKDAITPNTVAFLMEPIQGEAGVIVPKDGVLKELKEICKDHNILFILDEIQTGFGRTGKNFAFQHEDASPDILLVGKALGGGVYPVSAMLSNKEIMDVFKPGDHGSTFGGNPLGAAVGIASLDVLLEEDLARKSLDLGKYFIDNLKNLNSPYVKEIRGKGLLIGVEIKEEYGGARKFCEKLMTLGLLCKETHEHTIRFAPPLTITKEEIDYCISIIKDVLCNPI
ncbi:ornithine--oxo-acid transaminase [Clostridium sp.]|uniref:ornithine--oxo-acid transaminase n=1 Tax=Clostridium sp. TaxID=1506 RepID=UPI0034638C74